MLILKNKYHEYYIILYYIIFIKIFKFEFFLCLIIFFK